jgi:hypothetical protein
LALPPSWLQELQLTLHAISAGFDKCSLAVCALPVRRLHAEVQPHQQVCHSSQTRLRCHMAMQDIQSEFVSQNSALAVSSTLAELLCRCDDGHMHHAGVGMHLDDIKRYFQLSKPPKDSKTASMKSSTI